MVWKSDARAGALPAAAVLAFLFALPVPATEIAPQSVAQKAMIMTFDWHANGARDASVAKAKAALTLPSVINGPGKWVCSPAGFGQKSRCYSG